MDTGLEENVGQVDKKTQYQQRRKLASMGKDFVKSDKIRLAHERRICELNEKEKSFKEQYRRRKEATQLDLLGINSYRHVYRLYSYSCDDIGYPGINECSGLAQNHRTPQDPSNRPNLISRHYGKPLVNSTRNKQQNNEHPRAYEESFEIKHCNTLNWKYVLLPNRASSFDKRKEPLISDAVRPKTKPKTHRLKLWETPTYRTNFVSTVFPENCKTPFSYCKMINERAAQLRNDWSPTNVRKMKARCILNVEQAAPLSLVDRQRTTSALFRNYREVQSSRQVSSYGNSGTSNSSDT